MAPQDSYLHLSAWTSEDAFEASEAGEPIHCDQTTGRAICAEHGADYAEYEAYCAAAVTDPCDAAMLLSWLGY